MKIGIIFPKDSEALFDSNSSKTFGGASVQMFTIANELTKNQVNDIFCITPKFNFFDKSDLKLVEVFGIHKSIFSTILLFHKKIKKEKPDVLIQHGLTLFSCLLSAYCKLYNIKFVFMFASDLEVHGKYQSSQKQCYLFNVLIKTTNILVTQNKFQQDYLMKNSGVKSTLIHVGFPLQKYKNDFREVILWIGRCDIVKQPEIFINLARQYPKYKFVMICSKVDEDYFQKVKILAQSVFNLTFIDFVLFKDTWKYFEMTKLFVNTSKYEGFPQTFVQSVISGVPILSLNVNPDNFIIENNCGFVCKNNNLLLKENFNKIILDKDLYTKLSQNCLLYASKKHNLENNITSLLEILK